jgi:hypothetical protein
MMGKYKWNTRLEEKRQVKRERDGDFSSVACSEGKLAAYSEGSRG